MAKKMLRLNTSDFLTVLDGRCHLKEKLPPDAKILDARFDGFSMNVEVLIDSSEFMPGSHNDPNPLLDPTVKHHDRK